MLCENCGKREANVKYTENINGVTRELHLCEECSRKLGITDKIDFRMPSFGLSDFFEGFFEDLASSDFMPVIDEVKQIKCESCGTTFDDILNTGKYGCPNCYETFSDRMDPIIKKLQGANRHIGRLGKISDNSIKVNKENVESKDKKESENKNGQNELEKLNEQLKKAIKDERYEDAAKIRDQIKEITKNGNKTK